MLSPAFRPVVRAACATAIGLFGGGCVVDGGDAEPPPPATGVIYVEVDQDSTGRQSHAAAINPRNGQVDTLAIPVPFIGDPAVSPDGARLAFDFAENLFVYEFATGQLRVISQLMGSLGWAVWHPDGERVLVRRERRGITEYVLVNTDRSGERILFEETPYGLVSASQAWSPDGRWVYFTAFDLPEDWMLRRLDIATPGALPEVVGPPGVARIAISPVNGSLAILKELDGRDSVVVGLLSLSTNAIRPLRTYASAFAITWSSDGNHLAVLHNPPGASYFSMDIVVAATGEVVRTVRNVERNGGTLPSWGPLPPPRMQ